MTEIELKSALENKISRRHLFRTAAIAAGSAIALLNMGRAAIAKMTQKAAAYQATPKGDQKCSTCALFKASDNSCTLVDGSISADGWCRFFSKKAA